MKVIELIIDGFKSYAVRTVITGWDESFNSITGLNGSGKSNILDAICFVLGITNMTTVRAQNVQELIYKRGQAGVTKASVTIVFDNRDKQKSPIGFADYATISVTRQIVLGGATKYLINGHRAQQHTVQNLFQSVQLNINNPNFLIMQGKITKVLNMKAVEILAMIEEAAGTRMFEDRRDKAFKTMAKKELKLKEINELLRDEITPKLDKLRTEKRAFMDYQQTQNDVERLTRIVASHDYVQSSERSRKSAEDLEAKRQRHKDLEESAVRLASEIAILDEDLQKIREQRDKEVKKGGKVQSLEDAAKKHANELVRLSTVTDLKKSSIAEELEKKTAAENAVAELEATLREKTQALDETKARHDEARSELHKQTAEAESKEELLQTLQTGVASKDGRENGYQGQLQDARNRATAASTEQEQARIKIAHLEKRVREEEPRAQRAKIQNASLLDGLEGLKAQAQELERELAKLGVEPGQEEAVYGSEAELQRTIRDLRQEADALRRKVASVDFNYDNPVPNFDRSKVKGLVAQLFALDEARAHAGTALEICAGGRLYNVVVDSEVTASQLLQGGNLRKRVTIIPLNRINPYRASAQTIAAAQHIAPGKADLALSLIGYDDEVSAAMEFVFGSTLICDGAETAKDVTFHPNVRLRSITLEGDAYDPSGTLSGGSAPITSGVLVTLQKLNSVVRRLGEAEQRLRQVQAEIAVEKARFDKARLTKQELDLKSHEIRLAQEQINGNTSSSIIQEVDNMKESIVQLGNAITDAKARQAEASADVQRIEKDMKDFNDNKDGKLTELQKSLDKLRASLDKNTAVLKALQKELQGAQLDSEQAATDLATAREQVQELELAAGAHRVEVEDLEAQQAAIRERHGEAQAQLDEERAKLHVYDDELLSLDGTIRTKNARAAEEKLEMQKLVHLIDKVHKEQQAAAARVAHLERECEWIADEKDKFGRPGSLYDYGSHDVRECGATLKKMQDRFQGMKKKINPKVMNMIDSVEKKEASLRQMMKTVIKDKKKIEETIVSLDEYKTKELQKTWQKVNGDFGQIFSELLPGGSFAKLDPPEGKTISDGLEVKVCLGSVWKQSLAELSGGQRSLVALSLIMALLQFKPAPMYILDEVDAALDLSHTQNIGRLIKTRFKGSQFIVVSLKDGMFQNANRIFRTRFSEGTSMVQALTPADLR